MTQTSIAFFFNLQTHSMEIGAVNFEDLFDFSPEPASAAAAAAAAAPNRSSRPTAIPSSTQQQQQQQQQQGSNLNYSQSVPSNWGSAGFASSAQQVSIFLSILLLEKDLSSIC